MRADSALKHSHRRTNLEPLNWNEVALHIDNLMIKRGLLHVWTCCRARSDQLLELIGKGVLFVHISPSIYRGDAKLLQVFVDQEKNPPAADSEPPFGPALQRLDIA